MPTVADKYVPIFELGRGGMGDVVLAVVQGPGGFNKLQVVKQLRIELAENPEFLSMFLDEARLSARINHANVVQTNEVGYDGRHYFIAMEYLEGQSLEAFFTRAGERGPFSLPMFLRILADACAGLHHAHELLGFDGKPLNVVHRDVSPQNIFITYDGQTKVLDFGIAKAADSSSETRTGIIKGKVAYMAPEQFRSAGGVDRRADVFAMGAILWRVLAGKRLWKGLTDVEVYQRLATKDIPPPTELAPDAPPALVAICMKALAPEPEDRYQTAAAFQNAVEEYLETVPQQATQRVIGRELGDLFADRRNEVKVAIEARLAHGLPAQASTGELPQLGFPDLSGQLDLPGPMNAPSSGRTGMPPTLVTAGAGVHGGGTYAESSAPPRGTGAATTVLGVLAVVAVSAAGFAVWRATRPADVPVDKPVVVATDPGTPAADAKTSLTVSVTPEGARVFVDDVVMTAGTQSFPRDNAQHHLRVEAPDYEPYSQFVAFGSASVSLTIALDKKGEPRAAHPTGTGPRPGFTVRPTNGGRTSSGGATAAHTAEPTPTAQPTPTSQPTPTAQPTVATTATPTAEPTAAAADPAVEHKKGVSRTVRAHAGDVQACYDRAKMNTPTLAGVVVVGATLNPSGQVSTAAVTSTTARNTALENCLVDRFRTWTFPAPTGVSPTISYRFSFQ